MSPSTSRRGWPWRLTALCSALFLGCGLCFGCGAAAGSAGSTARAAEEPEARADDAPAVVAAPPAPEPIELPAGALELLARIDELSFPALEGRPLVRVHTGRSATGAGPEGREETLLGLLLLEEPDRFTVVHELAAVTYRTSRSWAGHEVTYEPVSWAESLEHAITTARAEVEGERDGRSIRIGRRAAGPRLRTVFLARAAMANGHERAARRLLQLACRMEGPSMPLHAPDDPVAALQGDLALYLLGLATEQYEQEEIDRRTLRDRLQTLIEGFEGCEAAAAAAQLLPVLERMLAEDRAGAPDDPMARLIHQLRDATYGGARAELTRMGMEAVPALLDILDDERLTRAVHTHHGLPSFQTYGDVARSILHSLSGELFGDPEEARRWWRQVERLGQEEVLARQVRRADYRSLSALRRLVQVDRRRAAREGMRAVDAADHHLVAMLLGILAEAGDAVPTRFFFAHVRQGPLALRIAAAEALRARSDERWIAPMVEALRERLEEQEPEGDGAQGGQPRRRTQSFTEDLNVRRVLDLLVRHGGQRGFDALTELHPRLAPAERLALLGSAAGVSTSDPEASSRVDALLGESLEDDSPAMVRIPPRGIRECVGTVGDAAAVLLGQRLGEPFDCAAPPAHRARARAALANALRRARGEEEEPLPPLPAHGATDPGELDAAVLALRTAERRREIDAALDRFAALGAAAAPRLHELASALPERHPAREPALARAAQLASQVTSIEPSNPGSSASEVRAWRGRSLSAADVAALLARRFAASPSGELTLWIHRDGAGGGLRVRESSESLVGHASYARIELAYAVRHGQEITRDWDHLEPLHALGMRGYVGLIRELTPVLEAAADVDGEALVHFTWSR